MTWTVKSKHGLFGCVTTWATKLTLPLLSSPFPPPPESCLKRFIWAKQHLCACITLLVHFLAVPTQLPLVASKLGHEIKNTCSNRVPDMTCFAAKHLKFRTAVKANCHAKGTLFICFWSASSAHISFFSTFRHISRSETAHLPPKIILNV